MSIFSWHVDIKLINTLLILAPIRWNKYFIKPFYYFFWDWATNVTFHNSVAPQRCISWVKLQSCLCSGWRHFFRYHVAFFFFTQCQTFFRVWFSGWLVDCVTNSSVKHNMLPLVWSLISFKWNQTYNLERLHPGRQPVALITGLISKWNRHQPSSLLDGVAKFWPKDPCPLVV